MWCFATHRLRQSFFLWSGFEGAQQERVRVGKRQIERESDRGTGQRDGARERESGALQQCQHVDITMVRVGRRSVEGKRIRFVASRSAFAVP